MRAITVTLLNFILLKTAFATLGTPVIVPDLDARICKLELESETGDESICTGSVINQSQIKTAAHCFEKASLKKVICNGVEIPFKNVTKNPRFDFRRHRESVEERRWDNALVNLANIFALPGISLNFKNYENTTELQQDFVRCALSGFGYQRDGSGKMGELLSVNVPMERIELGKPLMTLNASYIAEAYPGDSGGPLSCLSKEGDWKDLGTISGRSWENQSYLANNFFSRSFFFENYALGGFDFNAYLTGRSLLDLERKRREEDDFKRCQSKLAAYHTGLEEVVKDVKQCRLELRDILSQTLNGKYVKVYPFSELEALTHEQKIFHNGDTFTSLLVDRVENGYAVGRITSVGISTYYVCDRSFLCEVPEVDVRVDLDRIQAR